MEPVTQNDLLTAIRDAMTRPAELGDGFTGPELATASGKTIATVREAIRQLIVAGTVEPTRVRRQRMTGVWANEPGYRLK